MKEDLFNELLESIREMGGDLRDKKKKSRIVDFDQSDVQSIKKNTDSKKNNIQTS
jgi:hypothetical protein